MTKLKVLIPIRRDKCDLADHLAEFKKFQETFDVYIEELTTAENFINALKTKYNDISAVWATSSLYKYGGLNPFIDYLPKTVRIVAFPWVGHNAFDGKKLRERGIILANIGDSPAKDVADIALLLTLATFRYSSYLEHALRISDASITEAREAFGGENFDPKTGEPVPPGDIENKNLAKNLTIGGKTLDSPANKIAGIVGLGSIGKEIAKRLNAIGMEIKYTKRSPLTEKEAAKLPFDTEFYPTFEELIPHVDLLVIAVPHSEATINLINEKTIKLIKKNARIVNIGRGTAIDEDVLLKALDDGTINSVGLDVFQNEPKIDERFLNRWDVVILPHVGSFTVDNFTDANIKTIRNIEDVLLHDGPSLSAVN